MLQKPTGIWLSVILLTLFTQSFRAEAQYVPNYTFSQNQGTYTPITGGTVYASGTNVDDATYSVALPFNFVFDGTTYSQIYISTNGFISFGATNPASSNYFPISSTSAGFEVVSGFGYNLNSLDATTELRAQTTGIVPNQTYVIQWKNFSYSISSGITYNFQIRLNQTTNTIDIVYGSMTTVLNTTSGQIGLRGLSNTSYNNRSSSFGWTSTTSGSSNSATVTFSPSYEPSSGLTFSWAPPPACTVPLTQPTVLQLTPNTTSITGTFTPAVPAVTGYLVVMTPGTAALNTNPVNGTTYTTGNILGNGTVISVGSGSTFSNTGLTQSTYYTYTVFDYNNGICIGGPVYNTTTPLTASIETLGPKLYTWLATSGQADWQSAASWSPARTVPNVGDTLLFSNGGTSTAMNIPTQQVSVVEVTGNTNVSFNSTGTNALTVGNFFSSANGSSLSLGPNPITMAFATSSPVKPAVIGGAFNLTGRSVYNAGNTNTTINGVISLHDTTNYIATSGTTIVNGILAIADTGVYTATSGTTTLNNVVNLSGKSFFNISNGTVTVNDTVNDQGNANMRWTTGASSTTFAAGSVYNHMRDGGYMPQATYNAGSTVNITGVVSASPFVNTNQSFGNLIWNCPSQATAITVLQSVSTVKGQLAIINTGTYALKISGSPAVVADSFYQQSGTLQLAPSTALSVTGNVVLAGGTLDMNTSATNGTTLTIGGNLIQNAGHIITRSGTAVPIINFSGTTYQNVTINGTIAQVPISYTLNNAAGAGITGVLPVYTGAVNTISSGSWTGNGMFNYALGGTLLYNTPVSQQATAEEWPSTGGPYSLTLNLPNTYPNNRIYIPGSRSLKGTLSITAGVLVLGNNNLTMDSVTSVVNVSNPDSTKMIAADGTGQFIRLIAPGTTTTEYDFPVGDITGLPQYSAAHLFTMSNNILRHIGVRVTDAQHPDDNSTTNYVARYWSFTDDGGTAAYSYSVSVDYPNTDIVGTYDFKLNSWNGSSWLQLPSTSQSQQGVTYSRTEVTDTVLSAMYPLGGQDLACRSSTHNIYNWTGAVSMDYQVPANWNPNRTNPNEGDILQFGNGITDTVKNIASETISGLHFTNYTTAVLQPSTTLPAIFQELTIYSDFNNATNDLTIDSGSAVYCNGVDKSLSITLAGNNCNASIAGRLELINTSATTASNKVNITCTGCVATVTPSGTIAAGSTNPYGGFISLDSNSIIINGTYEHKYTTVNGFLPNARWGSGSTFNITGYTTCTGGPSTTNSTYPNWRFGKVIYNCPNQTVAATWTHTSAQLALMVKDTLEVLSTGTGSWLWGYGYNYNINNYLQTGGMVDMSGSANTPGGILNISNSFMQSGGTFSSSGTTVANTINFTGTAGTQNVSFKNASPAGPIIYNVSNNNGVNLGINGTQPSQFDVNNLGGIGINIVSPHPINISLPIHYNGTTTLTYTGQGSYAADGIVYPATYSPLNLAVNCGAGNVLTLPGSRTIAGTATLASNINIGADTLTIGTSATSPGTLSINSASFIWLTTGAITRWYGTTGLPTTPGAAGGVGSYPISYNGLNRTANLYFSTSTALGSGGTITVTHANVTGMTTGLSVADGTYTINDRSNASWQFTTGNGITMGSGSAGMSLTAEALLTGVTSAADLRVMQANSVAGNYVAGSGTYPAIMAQRSGLDLNTLTSALYYVGTGASNLASYFISVKSGSWQDGTTWNTGTVPGVGAQVFISNDDTVTINGSSNAKTVFVNPQGVLMADQYSLTVDSTITTAGNIQVAGGTVTMGPAGGGKQAFVDSGTVNVYSGTLNINGSLTINGGTANAGYFNQTGGHIYIDGNAGGVAANSVPVGTPLLNLASNHINFTGGDMTFIDPPAASNINFPYEAATISAGAIGTYAVFSAGHTVIFGDGVSATPGGSSNGFYLSTEEGGYKLGSVIINGTAGAANRKVVQGFSAVMVNLTLNNAGAEYNFNNYDLYLSGNLTANSNTIVDASGTLQLMDEQAAGPVATTLPQLISGTGTFNGINNGNGFSFEGIEIENSSAAGATFDIGNFATGDVRFDLGNIKMANGSTMSTSTDVITYGSQTSGWLIGKMTRPFANSYIQPVIFPLGDSLHYTPVTIQDPSPTGNGSITVGITETDHPNIATSPINPNESVNRYYTISASGTFGGNITLSLAWAPSQQDTGTLWPEFIAADYNNNSWTGYNVTFPVPYTVQISGLTEASINGSYQIGENMRVPVIEQQPVVQTACSGGNVMYTVNAELATGYQWQVNTGTGWANLSNGFSYSGINNDTMQVLGIIAVMNNYQYRCLVSNNIGTDTSAAAALNVNISVTPAVSVNASGSNICLGMSVSFTATPTNGGATPTYQWKKNGTAVGTNSSSYTDNALANSDVVTCTLNSSISCAVPNSVTSSEIIMTVNPVYSPSLTVAAANGTVCAGTTILFNTTTNVLNGTYQWSVNNNSITGATNAAYSYVPVNNDHVTCMLTTPVWGCYTTSSVISNTVTITVNPYITPTISVTGNATMCSGFNDAFTASTNVTGAGYQWQVNGGNTGSNLAGYTYQPVNNDIVRCILTMPAGCYTASMDTSNSIIMTVTTSTIPTITITCPADTLCAGSTQLYTATTNITGGAYQWLKNGSAVGTNSNTYSYTPANGDAIKCVLTIPTGCFTENTGTSNVITMTVNPVITPSLTITGNTSMCEGTSSTYNLTGNIPMATYQWQVNGSNVGSGSTNYTYVPVIGDHISCVLTVPATGCFSASSAGDTLAITVHPYITSTLSVTANHTSICEGSLDTFNAYTNISGGVYQWQINNVNFGTNLISYIYTPVNGDIIRCIVAAPSGTCYSPMQDTSNDVTMVVTPYVIPTISIGSTPGYAAEGQTVVVNATIGNISGSYIINWKNNNVIFNTTTVPTVSYIKGSGTDNIKATIIPQSVPCFDSTTSVAIDIYYDNTGVNGINNANTITIYPNPFTNEITVTGLTEGDQLCVYDMSGKKAGPSWTIKTSQDKNTFSILNLAPGSYIMRVLDKTGNAKANMPLKKID